MTPDIKRRIHAFRNALVLAAGTRSPFTGAAPEEDYPDDLAPRI